MAVGCIGYVVVMVVGDMGCGNLATEVVGECGSLAEAVVVGWHCGVAASDPAVGPTTALAG
jgi:hypothetical protein